MAHARCETELKVRIGHRPGDLARLLSSISARRINVLAYCAYSERDEGVVLLVTEDPGRTQQALADAGYPCRLNSVILVHARDKVGAAAALGAHLGRAGINILYSYASSTGDAAFHAVFKTDNDEAALRVLDAFNADAAA
jgi:hypothetical protein